MLYLPAEGQFKKCTHYNWIHSFDAKANGSNNNENLNQYETKKQQEVIKREKKNFQNEIILEISNTKLETKFEFFSSLSADTMNWE